MSKRLILASCFVTISAACTRKEIVFKPSSELDPLPASEGSVEEAQDPFIEKQWNLERIGFDAATRQNDTYSGSANVVIALLSTGVDYNHEDLQGRILINEQEMISPQPESTNWADGVDNDGNGLVDDIVGVDLITADGFAFDRHGAGTAVAGVIAARQNNGKGIYGLMSDVRILPIKYINDNGQTNVFLLHDALEAVVKTRPNVALIQSTQLTLGAGANDSEVAATETAALISQLEKIQAMGIPVVVSAGSDASVFGNRAIDKVLRRFDNIVFITGSNEKDELQFLANFSAQYVATAAPGEKLMTTVPGNKYAELSSTSFAAAHVAAAFGLAIAKHGQLAYGELINTLLDEQASDVVPALSLATLGRNRLNIKKFNDVIVNR